MNGQGDCEQSTSTTVDKGLRRGLHPPVTPGFECHTDSRLNTSAQPMEVDTETPAASKRENPP